MLLNPSHKITLSGLPPDLVDEYVRYKKGTRALVAWFIQYSPTPSRRVKSLPIKELESIAQTVSKKLRTLPDVIHFYFRETITARKRLSKYFRALRIDQSSEDVVTVNHEHFTTSLAKIYEDLCACCGSPNTRSTHQPRRGHSALASNLPVNQYDGLAVEEAEEYAGQETTPPTSEACPECTTAPSSSCEGQDFDASFADDQLGSILRATAAVQRIHEISSATENCWLLAGRGDLSFIVASFVTNVAFASLRQVGVELLEHDENLSLSELHQMCCSFDRSTGKETFAKHSLLGHLEQAEHSLAHYRDSHQHAVTLSCSSCTQKSTDYYQSLDLEDDDNRQRFSAAIIDNIINLVSSKDVPTSIVRNSTPVYADVGYLITRANENTQSWSAILGLNLLANGYRVYLRTIMTPKVVSQCRIAALRLANEASSYVSTILNDKACFPCRCTQTLAFHLQHLETDLNSYAKFNCWDLYFQSPWVAGNQVLEILDLCHYYGMRLLNYRHYVGAVLHSYNVLKQLGGLTEIPVLENLCTQLAGILFPGGNPPSNHFRASWARFVGARLKFKKGHKNKNSRDNWCMSIPPHAQRRAAGLGAGNDHPPGKIDCLLFQIKQQDYHVRDEQFSDFDPASISLQKAQNNIKAKKSSPSVSPALASAVPKRQLSDLAQAVQQSFAACETTPLPLARLNLFAVFDRCVHVVSRLSDETHTAANEKGINCICFCSEILSAADRIIEGRRLGKAETWKKHERECMTQANSAIEETFRSIKAEQWLWNV